MLDLDLLPREYGLMIANVQSANTLWLKRLVILIFALAVLQNLLPPNGFSGTVLIFDYEFGLMRRGLIGELANFYWGTQAAPREVLAVSAGLLLLGLVCMLVLVTKRLFQMQVTLRLALLSFSSFAFKAIVGFTGYGYGPDRFDVPCGADGPKSVDWRFGAGARGICWHVLP